jgi:hypothetical protein
VNHNNESGKEQAYLALTDEVIDRAWATKLQSLTTHPDAFENLQEALLTTLEITAQLLKAMIDYGDGKNVEKLVSRLQPAELFNYVDLMRSLRDGQQPNSYKSEMSRRVSQLKDRVQEFVTSLEFIAAGYVLEGYSQEQYDLSHALEFWQALKSHFGSFQSWLHSFVKILSSHPFGQPWSVFDRHPETKQGFSSDDSRKHCLVYCISGIEMIIANGVPDHLPAIELHDNWLVRLEKTCTEITDDPDKWAPFIEGFGPSDDLNEDAQRLITISHRMSDLWKQARSERIIEADLDKEKVATLKAAARRHYKQSQGLRSLLEQYGKVTRQDEVSRATTLGPVWWSGYKEFFTESAHYSQGAKRDGQILASRLIDCENVHIFRSLISMGRRVRSRKDWNGLSPYLLRALERFGQTGHQADLIIVPSSLRYGVLEGTQGFVSSSPSHTGHMPPIYGFYDQIPVIEWQFDREEPLLVIVDLKKALRIETEDPVINVRTFSDAEIEHIQERDPKVDSEDLQLTVIAEISIREKLIKEEKDAVLVLRLKLSEESFQYFPDDFSDLADS